MSGVWVGLRTLIGALPVAVERLVRLAVGPGSGWTWLPPVVPYLFAGLTALAVGALTLTTLQTARDYPPLAVVATGAVAAGAAVGGLALLRGARAGLGLRLLVAVCGAVLGGVLGVLFTSVVVEAPVLWAVGAGLLIGGLVLGWRLHIAGSARTAASSIRLVPALVGLLSVLTLLPLLHAGAELIITRATVVEFVERRIGFSSSLVEIQGLALLASFPAEAPIDPERGPDPHPYHWWALRENLSDRRIALVRSTLDRAALQRREIVARVVDDPAAVTAAEASLGQRGVDPGELATRLLDELSAEQQARAGNPTAVESVLDLADLPAGGVVRLTLDFSGEGTSSCASACDARRLGRGLGEWVQLARDPDGGQALVVRTSYPPSVAPVHVYGRQTADPGAVERFVGGPWTRLHLGWANVLRGSIVQQDLSLPVDRLWLGPILFAMLAALLWLGSRTGYPIFTPEAVSSGTARPGPVAARATGRVTAPGISPVDLEAAAVSIDPGQDGAEIEVTGSGVSVQVPRALGALSELQPGELRFVRGRRPALQVSWYGSNLLLVFGTDAERDAAAALLRSGR